MARGPWGKCPLTGISKRKLSTQVGETILCDDEVINPEVFPDCDIFDVRSFTAAAGYKDVAYFVDVVLQDSACHAIPVRTESGRSLGFATNTISAEAGGKAYKKKTDAKRIKNLKQNQD